MKFIFMPDNHTELSKLKSFLNSSKSISSSIITILNILTFNLNHLNYFPLQIAILYVILE